MNKPPTLKLMIIDDHYLFIECLASLLNKQKRFNVIGIATTLFDAIESIKSKMPDILLIGQGFPAESISSFIRQITLEVPQAKVMIFGMSQEQSNIIDFIEAGARGSVLKDTSMDDFMDAISRVYKGETVFPPQMINTIELSQGRIANQSSGETAFEPVNLTAREAEILQLIAEGLSNQQIAERLCLSLHTVKNHVHRMLAKLGVRQRSEAVYYGLREGIVKISPQKP